MTAPERRGPERPGPEYPPEWDRESPEPEFHCICGSGDEAEWHSLLCVAGNTPDDEWYGDYPARECDHENGECHDIEHQRKR